LFYILQYKYLSKAQVVITIPAGEKEASLHHEDLKFFWLTTTFKMAL
jgi:hypothetical protein